MKSQSKQPSNIKTTCSTRLLLPEGDWVTFGHLGEGVDPLISAVVEGGQEEAVAVLDSGQEDGVRKVVIGGRSQEALRLWFVRLLVLDCLDHLSSGRIRLPLTRYLMVDIDDIFTGTARLLQEDVQAMLESQARIARTVTDFRYNLGFSGKTFLQVGLFSHRSCPELFSDAELLVCREILARTRETSPW